MTYIEEMKLWIGNPDDYEYKIEYLKFEEGGPFPEVMHKKNPHVAYKTDNMNPHLEDADQIIFGPVDAAPSERMAFIIKDGAIIELYEAK